MCRVFVVWIVVRLFRPASHFWSQPLKPWWPDTNKTLKSWRSSKPLQPRRTQSLHHDLGKRLCDPQTLFLGRFCYIAFLEGCFSDFGLKITQRNRLLDFLGSCLFVVFLNKSQSQNLWFNLYDHIWNPWCPLHWGWWVGEILHSSWGPKSPLVSLLMVFLVASQVQHCKFHRQLKVIIVGWNVFDSWAVDPRDVLRDRPRRLHCSTETPQPQPPGGSTTPTTDLTPPHPVRGVSMHVIIIGHLCSIPCIPPDVECNL